MKLTWNSVCSPARNSAAEFHDEFHQTGNHLNSNLMKKNLLNSILAATAVMYFSLSAFSAPIDPVRTMDIPHLSQVTLDGAADFGYGALQDTDWGYPDQQEGYGGETDFKAEFQVCWNETNLFLLAVMSDDVEHDYDWAYSSSWMFDNIEIFLQLDTNTVTTSYDDHTIQLRVCRGLDSIESAGRAARTEWGYYMESQAAGGWITELAIPWTAVLAEGEGPELSEDYVGIALGFDFAGADSDNSDGDETVGNRDYQTFWDLDGQDGTEDLAWNNTSTFGYVELTGGIGVNTLESTPLSIYPNPAGESIMFPELEKESTIAVYSMLGTQVIKVLYQPGEELDISRLQSGMYMAVIDGSDAITFVKK